MIADQAISSTEFSYASIEGNFITGLEVNGLAYREKALFDVAKLHWNPIGLLYREIVLTELDVEGVDIEHILVMAEESKKSNAKGGSFGLPLALTVEKVHLDINPYNYEGLKVSNFLLTTDRIELDDGLKINTKNLFLSFDSNIVNVELLGDIQESRLLINRASLKEISSRGITKLVHLISAKKHQASVVHLDENGTAELATQGVEEKKEKLSQKVERSEPILKEIKVNHIFATMKDVTYGPLTIKGVKLYIDKAEFDTYNSYSYKAKSIKAVGGTNFGRVNYKGYIKDSNIYAKGGVVLSKELFRKYGLPLNYKNLRKLPGSLHLNHQGVWITVDHKVKELLKIKNSFNLDVTRAKHNLHYDYRDRNLTIESKMRVNMPYGENVKVNNKVLVNVRAGGYTTYEGDVKIPNVKGLPPEIATYLLEGLSAKFKGDKDGLLVEADSKLIEGEFLTKGYKNATLKLKSKSRNVVLGQLISALPSELKNELVALESESYFDFKSLAKSKVNLKVTSNLLNADGSMKLNRPYKIRFNGTIPSNSKMMHINKNINFNNLREIAGEVLVQEKNYLIRLNNKRDLKLYLNYDAKAKILREGRINLAGEEINLASSTQNDLALTLNVKRLETLLPEIERYYNIALPKLKGAVDLTVKKRENALLRFTVKSPKVTYLTDTPLEIKTIDSRFTIDRGGNIVIEKYRFRVDTNPYFRDFYAHKKSYLSFRDGTLFIKKLWFNNQAEIEGRYEIEKLSGDLVVKAKKFPFINKEFDLLFDIDAKVKMRKKLIDVDADINILGNSVHYDIEGSGIAEDADIIVVQEMKNNQESALKNLKLYLKIKSEKPLKYYGSDTQLEFFNELRVVKNYKSEMMVTGMTTVTNGFYQMEDKRFVLNESHLYFAGDPRKPLLDIKASYEKDQYLVHIFISGTTEEPIVNFNSEPFLTQQEILSLILFDGTGSSSGQGAEAYTLLGGTFAKGLMKSLGIDVDHLLLGTDANDALSLEVGRKISKDITIMYMLKDGKNGAKVRIEHNRNFETDIIVQPPNTSSIEFLYKKDR
jgi:hypothetical protein